MLRLLRNGIGDSSEAQSMVLGFLSFKMRVHLTYFRSGMEMDLSWGACESLTSLGSKLKVFIGSSW